jgi:hypothetical protein
MGFLSNLFGGNKEQKALEEAFGHIRRILDDEEFQLNMVQPALQELIKGGSAFDRDPNGSGPFGFSEANPIPVNGPIGQLAYLSKLETLNGERILFHRIGAINRIDVFEAVTFSGGEWFVLFTDMYHPRRSRSTPSGFRFTQEVGQFSGFHKYCVNFPYDFVEMKSTESESGLSFAYIAISKVTEQIEKRAFRRPLAHNAKLDLIKNRLTSRLSQ